jgi:hypothetical protein
MLNTMNLTDLYNQMIQDFDLKDLPQDQKDEMLTEIAKTIQKQFLLDIYDLLGSEKFDALQASANMGEEFYTTTLKHLVPNYEDLFRESQEKIKKAFQEGTAA